MPYTATVESTDVLAASAAGAILGMRATVKALKVNGLPTDLFEAMTDLEDRLKEMHRMAVTASGLPYIHTQAGL